MSNWVYFSLDGVPARVRRVNDRYAGAEIYMKGQGFVPGPEMTILHNGRPISADAFHALVRALDAA